MKRFIGLGLLFWSSFAVGVQVNKVIPIALYNIPGKLSNPISQSNYADNYSKAIEAFIKLFEAAGIPQELNDFASILADYESPEIVTLSQAYSAALAKQCRAQSQGKLALAQAQEDVAKTYANLDKALKLSSSQEKPRNRGHFAEAQTIAEKLKPYKDSFNTLYQQLKQASEQLREQDPCNIRYFELKPTGDSLLEQVVRYLYSVINGEIV